MVIENKISDLSMYINHRDKLEGDIEEKLSKVDIENADE